MESNCKSSVYFTGVLIKPASFACEIEFTCALSAPTSLNVVFENCQPVPCFFFVFLKPSAKPVLVLKNNF